jgi:hypothetical protein
MIWGDRITPKAVWHVVRAAAKRADIKGLAPTTCAAPAHGCAIWQAESLSRFNFCLGVHPLRPLSGISTASSDSARPFGTNHTLVFVAGFKVISGPRGFGTSGVSRKQHSGLARKIGHKRQASPRYYSEM